MKVLFDTNILLDLLLERRPFSDLAADLLSRADRGEIQGFACATSFTTIFYLSSKVVGLSNAREHIRALLSILSVAPVTRAVLEGAIVGPVGDFEDAAIVESARQINAQAILTRDEKGFRESRIPVHSPTSLLVILNSGQPPA